MVFLGYLFRTFEAFSLNENVGLRWIQTRIVAVDVEHGNHLTTVMMHITSFSIPALWIERNLGCLTGSFVNEGR